MRFSAGSAIRFAPQFRTKEWRSFASYAGVTRIERALQEEQARYAAGDVREVSGFGGGEGSAKKDFLAVKRATS
jgi:hypothetical protein